MSSIVYLIFVSYHIFVSRLQKEIKNQFHIIHEILCKTLLSRIIGAFVGKKKIVKGLF